MFAIKALVGLIPGISMFVGAAILQFYPLKGQRLLKMQQDVLGLHAQKREQYEKLG